VCTRCKGKNGKEEFWVGGGGPVSEKGEAVPPLRLEGWLAKKGYEFVVRRPTKV